MRDFQNHSFSLTRRLMRALSCAVIAAVLSSAIAGPAASQNWWPFGGNEEPRRAPTPREPVYRPDNVPAPIPEAAPPPVGNNWATKNPICLQLEQRLVSESQKGSQTQDQLPKIESEIRKVDRAYNVGAQQLEQSCYEYFLFTKQFRSTPQCRELVKQVEGSKQKLAQLEAQRQDLVSSGGRSYQDDIIRELARNNCGANYADQARRRDNGMWEDEEAISGGGWAPANPTGVATYRTLCVRLCDGYYFPVSFSTLPSHFPQDAESCQSKCAAPTELYYYPNPGSTVDQSVALSSQQPYTQLKSAFRYRKEYVNGCSCKEAEYDSAANGDKKAGVTTSSFPARRAESNGASPVTTGSTNAAPAAVAPASDAGSWQTGVETQPLPDVAPPQ